MVWHEDVRANEPGGGALPGLNEEGVRFVVGEPGRAMGGAERKEDDGRRVRCGEYGL